MRHACPNPTFTLTIIFFCDCNLPGQAVRTEIWIVEIKEQSLTILLIFSLFHVYISNHVHEKCQEEVIHQGNVNLEYITLPTEICCVKAVLSSF